MTDPENLLEFKSGQIYFLNGKDWFGKTIRAYNLLKFGRSDCSHCGIIASVEENQVLVFEATPKGFVRSYYPKSWLYEQMGLSLVHIGEPKENPKNVLKNCEKYEGIKYAWIDYIAIAAGFLFGAKFIGITGKNSLICSEAVCRVLYDCSKTIDFQKEYKTNFDQITPEHIFLSKQVRIIK